MNSLLTNNQERMNWFCDSTRVLFGFAVVWMLDSEQYAGIGKRNTEFLLINPRDERGRARVVRPKRWVEADAFADNATPS